MSQTPPALEKRRQPGRIRAIILAVAVHAAFFALIVFGVTWQSRPEAPVEAELWKDLPPVTKAETKPPEPAPEPPKPEPPKPEPPKPTPSEPPKEVKAEPPKPDPAIAEKKEREKREREKKEKEKAEKEKAEKDKRERLEREAEKKKQDDLKKKREDDKRRVEEDKAKREAEKAREAVAAARQSEMERYVNGIKVKVRGRANVPDTVTGKPSVILRIRILPGGEVLDVTIERPSGNRVYDAAIERAVRSASPLPVPPADSELFPQFRDLRLNIEHDR